MPPLLQLEQRTAFLAPPESHGCSWLLSGLICVEPAGLLLGAGVADSGIEGSGGQTPSIPAHVGAPAKPGGPCVGSGGTWGCVLTGPTE